MKLERVPETNEFGLVLSTAFEYETHFGWGSAKRARGQRSRSRERHHLYWPRELYGEDESTLSGRFRECHSNIIRVKPRTHDRIHKMFDGVPIPPDDVMASFLEEVGDVEEFSVRLHAVEQTDQHILAGDVSDRNMLMVEERREANMALLDLSLKRVQSMELVSQEVARLAVERALTLSRPA